MGKTEYRWEISKVLHDWQSRRVTKLRANPPADYTTSTLKFIRTMACQTAGVSNCLYWSARQPVKESADDSDSPCFPCPPCEESEEEANPPELDCYPCKECKNPGISMFDFSAALFGESTVSTKAKLNKCDKDQLLTKQKRVIRRFVNGSAPMQQCDFMRAIANAWLNGWLTPAQIIPIIQNTIKISSVRLTYKFPSQD